MRIFKTTSATVLIEHEDTFYRKEIAHWDDFINRKSLYALLLDELNDFDKLDGSNSEDDGARLAEDAAFAAPIGSQEIRSEEHTSELQSLMRISYAVFCLKT